MKNIFNRSALPRKLRSVKFKENDFGYMYSFLSYNRIYGGSEIGDIWLIALRTKDDKYNIQLHNKYLIHYKKEIASSLKWQDAVDFIKAFEDQAYNYHKTKRRNGIRTSKTLDSLRKKTRHHPTKKKFPLPRN